MAESHASVKTWSSDVLHSHTLDAGVCADCGSIVIMMCAADREVFACAHISDDVALGLSEWLLAELARRASNAAGQAVKH